MPTRYDYRTIFFNQEPLYDTLFEERHVKGIRHYSTPRLKYPTSKEMQQLVKQIGCVHLVMNHLDMLGT